MEIVCANPLCNKPFTFKGGTVHFGRSTKHYCCRSCQNTTHGQAGTLRHRIWEHAKKRAKENGTIFTLDLSDIPAVPETCQVLGIRIIPNKIAGPLDSSPSLDRMVARLGYVPGNIRIISNRANRLRSDGTAEELAKVAADCAKLEKYGA